MLFLGGHLGDIGNILNFGHIGNYLQKFIHREFDAADLELSDHVNFYCRKIFVTKYFNLFKNALM
jgi:hypothetical protein